MDLNSKSAPTPPVTAEGRVYLWVMRCFVAYFLASILTLPFKDAIWVFGELPLLPCLQVPKIPPANWLREHVVMVTIKKSGLSAGSFSPDYGMARPYALAIVYLIPLCLLLATVWVRTKLTRPYRRWMCATLVFALLDFWFTLRFAGGPGLSFY